MADHDFFATTSQAIVRFLDDVGTEHPRAVDVLTLQARWHENISQTQIEGDTEQRRADRAQICHAFNTLALETLGRPFLVAGTLAPILILPLDTIPDVAALPSGSRMPLARNPLFVGREDDLKQLAATLQGGGTAAIGQIAAATGLGGIGKTNLATEFVHRYGQYFAGGVFWLSFADAAAVPSEIAACGVGLGLPGFESLKLDEQVARVRHFWQQPIPRLLIFDNCEDETLLGEHRPKTGGCCVLMTSRRARWDVALGVMVLALDVLPRAESITLLRRFRPDLAPDDRDLDAIAAELGDLPLALHLAGSFLARYRQVITLKEYLAQLRSPALLTHRSLSLAGISPTGHDHDVGRTFALSYSRLDPNEPTDALGLALLARAAYFAPGEPIPRDLLLATVELDSNDALEVEDALVRLIELGLLERTDEGALQLHRLLGVFVQVVVQDVDAQTTVEQGIYWVVNRLNKQGLPGPLLALQGHLRYLTDRAMVRDDERTANLCSALGSYLRLIGDYRSARSYLERTLTIRRAALGEMHPDTAARLNNLGSLLQDIGDLMGARPYYEQALAIWRTVLGEQHPNTTTGLNNLGLLLKEMGDLVGAQPYLEQALAILLKVLGEEHPFTSTSLNNLGLLLQDMGDLAGARPYYEQALAIYKKVLGEMHPDTASSLNNLGLLLKEMGDLAGARLYQEQALAVRRAVLGEMHPDTAASLNSLGTLLMDTGDLARARSYLEQALATRMRVLGEMHLDTAQSLNNLGTLLMDAGDLVGARPYLEQALVTRRAVLGEMHPDIAQSLNNVGSLLQDIGDLIGARPYYEQALAIWRTVLGEQHPDTTTGLNNLGLLLKKMSDLAGARLYLEQALAIRRKVLGEEHPSTANSLNSLGTLLQDMGDLEGAQPYLEQALATRQQVLGKMHPDTASSLNNLAVLLANAGRFHEAIPLMQQALAVCETILGPKHPHAQAAQQSLVAMEQVVQQSQGSPLQTSE